MSWPAATIRRRPTPRRSMWWIGIVVAILLAAPVSGGNLDTVRSRGSHPSDHARAIDAPAWTATGLASTRPDTNDRRDRPGGTLPGIVVCALVAFVVGTAARARATASGKPRVAFRRRGPPPLQTVR